MTTGKKFVQRTQENTMDKVLDQRTKVILNAIASEPRGRMLIAYLKAMKQEK